MTSMQVAFVNAGIKLPPVRQRIFNWLKDHPEKTAEDIGKGLGLGYTPFETLIRMERAGELKVYSDVSHKPNGFGVRMKVKRYSCGVKELVPGRLFVPKPKPVTKSTDVLLVPAPAPSPVGTPEVAAPAAPAPAASFDPEAFISNLSLSQMRVLAAFLASVFK